MKLYNRSFLGTYNPLHKFLLFVCDLACIAFSFSAASYLRFAQQPYFLSLEFIGLSIIMLFSLIVGGTYGGNNATKNPKLPLRSFFVILASIIPSMLFLYTLGPEKFNSLFGRGVFPFAITTLGILCVLSRLIINRLFKQQFLPKKILYLTEKEPDKHVINTLKQDLLNNTIAHASKLKKDTNSNWSNIIIDPSYHPDEFDKISLIDFRLQGTPIYPLADYFETFLFLIPVKDINLDWFLRAEGFSMVHSSISNSIKRVIDLVLAFSLSIISLPISLITALAIKLSSKGPIIFQQTRVGEQGRLFTIYKFRTMRHDAEKSEAKWASANDPRILGIGSFLRKTRIDELPQCINVIKGDMSFIGPRPERPEFTTDLAKEIPYYDLRHLVKPGLTGWAQVMYPYGASKEDALRKLQYDLYYIKNHSLLLDLNIMLRTVITVFQRAGR